MEIFEKFTILINKRVVPTEEEEGGGGGGGGKEWGLDSSVRYFWLLPVHGATNLNISDTYLASKPTALCSESHLSPVCRMRRAIMMWNRGYAQVSWYLIYGWVKPQLEDLLKAVHTMITSIESVTPLPPNELVNLVMERGRTKRTMIWVNLWPVVEGIRGISKLHKVSLVPKFNFTKNVHITIPYITYYCVA